MKYELVVFDWDGTLLDSAGAIVVAIQAACRDIGHPQQCSRRCFPVAAQRIPAAPRSADDATPCARHAAPCV